MFGARRDTPDRVARHPDARPFLRHIAGVAGLTSVPTSAPVFANAPDVFDQGSVPGEVSNSCGGHALSFAVHVGVGAQLGWGVPPSMLAFYRLAQMIARQAEAAAPGAGPVGPSLPDDGCYTADLMQACAIWGSRPMGAQPDATRLSDCNSANVRVEEDIIALQKDSASLISGPYRIDPTASDFIDQICIALAARIPVVTAGFVDSAFMYWKGGTPCGAPNMSDPQGGGHALALNGEFEVTPSGLFVCYPRNSWGRQAGVNGDWEVDDAFMRSRWDTYVCPFGLSSAPGALAGRAV